MASKAEYMEEEVKNLSKKCEELQKRVEEETLARVDLENTVKSIREELSVKDARELANQREKTFRDLCHDYVSQMRGIRVAIESLFDTKIRIVQQTEELRLSRCSSDTSTSELEQFNSSFDERIRDMQLILRDAFADLQETVSIPGNKRKRVSYDESEDITPEIPVNSTATGEETVSIPGNKRMRVSYDESEEITPEIPVNSTATGDAKEEATKCSCSDAIQQQNGEDHCSIM